MASSLILLSASDLAGQWTLQQDEAPAICHLELRDSEVAEASGYDLGGDTACLTRWLPSEPRAWRPTPAGIALLERGGLTLMLLGRQGEGDCSARATAGSWCCAARRPARLRVRPRSDRSCP